MKKESAEKHSTDCEPSFQRRRPPATLIHEREPQQNPPLIVPLSLAFKDIDNFEQSLDEGCVASPETRFSNELNHLVDTYGVEAVIDAAKEKGLRSTGEMEALKPDVYSQKGDNESVKEFLNRIDPHLPMYRGNDLDGHILEFIRRVYRDRGYLDGKLFKRSVLREIDPPAEMSLQNWLKNSGEDIPTDIALPYRKRTKKIHKSAI